MKRIRRIYYDVFSGFYDRFVALHSRDRQGHARRFLADQVVLERPGTVLDLCTGTGTLLTHLSEKIGGKGRVVGADFSRGMLKAGRSKTAGLTNVHLVEADAGGLPFAAGAFDAVTCSHAFYELKGRTRDEALREIVRILKAGGTFLMMEHDVPANPFVRFLFTIRLTVVGAGRARAFLRDEQHILEGYFGSVRKILAPAGRSKVMVCTK